MAIDRTRFDSIRLKKLFPDKAETAQPDNQHDPKLPFRRSLTEEYTFKDGCILLNGIDVATVIETPNVDVELCSGLMSGVGEYRNTVWMRYGTDKKDFNGKVQGLLEKLLGKLTHVYEEMTGGMRVHLQSGKLWINDIDPKVVLSLFLSNPTDDRRRYLMSIQTKLGLILEGKVGKAHSDGLIVEAKRIYHQIATALENQSPTPLPLLLANGDHLDR